MRVLFILLIALISFSSIGQSYPKDYFRSPLDIPLHLAGTFAELRSNHFHSGIDIKTQGVVGQKVYAIADGYVARVKISPYGYGKAIYIRHPNGYTSVYAHLHEFKGELADLIEAEHYRRKSFKMDYFPTAGTIKVTKGQVIALSGNSGSSGGPHLHFEIRDSRTEHPLNPLFFGYKIKDSTKPTLKKLYLYEYQDEINTKRTNLTLTNLGTHYILTHHDTLTVPQKFYFGINAIDRLDGFANQNGVYSMEVFSNNEKVFSFKADEFSFGRSRYLNSYIDFGRYKSTSERIQKTYIEPNNKSRIIWASPNKGLFQLSQNEIRNIEIIISDYEENKTVIKFVVKRKGGESLKNSNTEGLLFKWNEENKFTAEGCEFQLPANVLYTNILFKGAVKEAKWNAYSKTYQLHNDSEPLQTYCKLKIKPSKAFPSSKAKQKACIVSTDSKGRLAYEGGKWEGEYMVCKTRSFGNYYISTDTVAPVVKGLNVFNGKNISGLKKISFKISDNLSGISSYKGYVDGNWILFDYDAKNQLLSYLIDDHFPKGTHELKLHITDAKGNRTSLKYKLHDNKKLP